MSIDKIKEALTKNPNRDSKQIADEIGTTRVNIHRICYRAGVTFNKLRQDALGVEGGYVSMTALRQQVCERHGVTVDELMGPSKYIEIVQARCELAYRLHVEGGYSSTQTAKAIGRKNHTSALYFSKRWPEIKDSLKRPTRESLASRVRVAAQKKCSVRVIFEDVADELPPPKLPRSRKRLWDIYGKKPTNRTQVIDRQIRQAKKYGQPGKEAQLKKRRELVLAGKI